MESKFDWEYLERMNFRRHYLENTLIKVKNAILGRSSPIREMITDNDEAINGNFKYSDVEIEFCISVMINFLEEIQKNRASFSRLTDKQKEFYRCFLYCVMQGIRTIDQHHFEVVESWADIIAIASDPDTTAVSTETDLYTQDLMGSDSNRDFFKCIKLAFSIIKGEPIVSTYPLEKREKAFEQLGNALIDPWDFLATDKLFADKELYNKCIQWKNSLPDPEKYAQCCVRYRELYFQVNLGRLAADIETMIDIFLCEFKISAFGSINVTADIFEKTEGYLKAVERRIKKW